MSISSMIKSFVLACLLSFMLVGIVFSQDCSDDQLNMNMDVERPKCELTINQRKTIMEFLDGLQKAPGDSQDFLNKRERYYFLLMMDFAGNPEAYSSDEREYVKVFLRKVRRELEESRGGDGKKSSFELEMIKKAEILKQRSFTSSGVEKIDLLKQSLALYREPSTVFHLFQAYYAEQMYANCVKLFSSIANEVANGDESYVYSKGYRNSAFYSSFYNFLPLLGDEENSSLLSNSDIENIAKIIPIYYEPYIDIKNENGYIDDSDIFLVGINIINLVNIAKQRDLLDVVEMFKEDVCNYSFMDSAYFAEEYSDIKALCLE